MQRPRLRRWSAILAAAGLLALLLGPSPAGAAVENTTYHCAMAGTVRIDPGLTGTPSPTGNQYFGLLKLACARTAGGPVVASGYMFLGGQTKKGETCAAGSGTGFGLSGTMIKTNGEQVFFFVRATYTRTATAVLTLVLGGVRTSGTLRGTQVPLQPAACVFGGRSMAAEIVAAGSITTRFFTE
jgi:hypothetical protein